MEVYELARKYAGLMSIPSVWLASYLDLVGHFGEVATPGESLTPSHIKPIVLSMFAVAFILLLAWWLIDWVSCELQSIGPQLFVGVPLTIFGAASVFSGFEQYPFPQITVFWGVGSFASGLFLLSEAERVAKVQKA